MDQQFDVLVDAGTRQLRVAVDVVERQFAVQRGEPGCRLVAVVDGIGTLRLEERRKQRHRSVMVVRDLDDASELRVVDVRGGVDLPEALLGGVAPGHG